MPVPDKVFWGKNIDNHSLFYKDIRALHDDNKDDELIDALRLRLSGILNKSAQILDDNGAAFPLITMTCIGIETLGQIFYSNESGQSGPFEKVCGKTHQNFNRNFSQDFKEKLYDMWPENDEIEKMTTFSKLMYRYMRNEMIHGYQARGVYLSYEDTERFKQMSGYFVINPHWFWMRYLDIFNDLFFNEAKKKNSKARKNCLKYIDKMIK